ncbi:MAG TPA: tRNA preQ1(34) S-adenosylmethionine ribosyltransferase-isomerase QueA [Candidatus Woesebacteria bacterium]|nr:tRNA preQ1(34) S-adenosylmethionine ribosyltransferase-isomerase QueA [Candidatus Woesebacteria bacterium]HNS94871.1 tRNA preQ1(34) S-adenosylmethionine ribosyltransferase-isomerase QueA [Candidatus Woesebacteria bacterium]
MPLADFDFELPPERIAQSPAHPRDHARLLVYHSAQDRLEIDRFYNISRHIQPKSLMVFNETCVAPVRITLQKQSGGKIVCLFMLNTPKSRPQHVDVMVDRKVEIGDNLYSQDGTILVGVWSAHREKSIFELKLSLTSTELFTLLQQQGNMPLPPYIDASHTKRESMLHDYQTVYAKTENNDGGLFSIAAPTAGLHFTHETFASLRSHDVEMAQVALEVGLGTFAPITETTIRKGVLHSEWYKVPPEANGQITNALEQKRPIIAVGTTTVRTLESYSRLPKASKNALDGYHHTSIFIQHPFHFEVITGLITNFHLPKSSLMMLVDAFLRYKQSKKTIKDLYNFALANKCSFYSFGDAMLIL